MEREKSLLTLVITATLLIFGCVQVDAASWRINNNANRHAHFTDINAAMSSSNVQAGDTLYLDPGCTLTSSQTVSKRVTIIGTGYFLPSGTYTASTIGGTLTLKAADTKVEGVTMTNTTYAYADRIIIERCKTVAIVVGSSSYSARNVVIRQCYLSGFVNGVGKTGMNSAYCTIENCIIVCSGSHGCIYQLYAPTIRNNYLKETGNYAIFQSVSNTTIKNNIEINTKSKGSIFSDYSNTINSNNVLSSASGAEGNRFLDSTAESLVFALEGTNDQKYQLKEGSPALGFADDGGDCGPYGGLHPYVPSGYPLGIPYVVTASGSTSPSDGKVAITNQVNIQKQ